MVFESAHTRVTAEYGTATLWFGFPGEPTNALDLASLRELDAALAAVSGVRSLTVVVIRSSIPHGFCAGLRPRSLATLTRPAERAAFAWYGQQVFDRIAGLDAVSVAFIDGPCLDAGLELALACDHRLCVARPTTHLGFPQKFACFGGTARARHLAGRGGEELISSGRTISGREALAMGLADVACCERRAKIELRTFLDHLEARPVKPSRPAALPGRAAERRDFARREFHPTADATRAPATNPLQPFPDVVAILGDDPDAARIAADVALRGGSAVLCGSRSPVFVRIDTALRRGFVTPLEAERARARVRASDTLSGFDRAGLVFVAEGHDPFRLAAVVRPRAVICVISPGQSRPAPRPTAPFPYPRRLTRVSFCDGNRVALCPDYSTDADTTATLTAWLKPLGFATVVFPVAARLLPRAA